MPLEESLATFWESGEDWESFSLNLAPPTLEYALLRRLGSTPFKEDQAGVDTFLEKIYHLVGEATQQRS